MGAFDGAEICELVGTFILHEITKKYNKESIGLYRDDGLAVFKNVSGPESEKNKETLLPFFYFFTPFIFYYFLIYFSIRY